MSKIYTYIYVVDLLFSQAGCLHRQEVWGQSEAGRVNKATSLFSNSPQLSRILFPYDLPKPCCETSFHLTAECVFTSQSFRSRCARRDHSTAPGERRPRTARPGRGPSAAEGARSAHRTLRGLGSACPHPSRATPPRRLLTVLQGGAGCAGGLPDTPGCSRRRPQRHEARQRRHNPPGGEGAGRRRPRRVKRGEKPPEQLLHAR